MASLTVQQIRKLPPSLLARKILCIGYVPAPFEDEQRFRFQALHAMAVVRVIARHLRTGYELKDIERGGRGYRVDLLFEQTSSGRTRLVEVKSAREIREVHRLQASLYPHSRADEVCVSNRERDEILTPDFVEQTLQRAEVTRRLLLEEPEAAATKYTPHPDCCYTCANFACPFLASMKTGENLKIGGGMCQ